MSDLLDGRTIDYAEFNDDTHQVLTLRFEDGGSVMIAAVTPDTGLQLATVAYEPAPDPKRSPLVAPITRVCYFDYEDGPMLHIVRPNCSSFYAVTSQQASRLRQRLTSLGFVPRYSGTYVLANGWELAPA